MSRRGIFLLGVAAVLAATLLWHGPLGAGERLAAGAEATARRTLDYYELPGIAAHLQRSPLSRQMILSGPADNFQRAELIRILDEIPGVLDVRWENPGRSIPLGIEAILFALTGFALGLVLAYIGELRRRANRWKRKI